MPKEKDDGFEIGPGFASQPEPPKAPKPSARQPEPEEDDLDEDDLDEDDLEGADDSDDEDDLEGADDSDDEDEDDEDDVPKKRKKTKTASERIRELNRRMRAAERERDAALEMARMRDQRGLPAENSDGNTPDAREAPDPNDTEKYPLGSLDDRYIEDKIAYLAEQKARETVDSVLQRQQKNEQDLAAQQQAQALLETAATLADRGSELYDDYQETVVDAGFRGDYDLDQPTFEAAAEAEHGAQILYDLALDPKEASRVAKLSPFQQIKYVQDKNAELSGSKPKPRRKPRAPEPPRKQPRGKSVKYTPPADTDNLDDFEKLWEKQFK